MQLREKSIESIIRYWVLLEELKRHKKTVFGTAPQPNDMVSLTFWRTPEEANHIPPSRH